MSELRKGVSCFWFAAFPFPPPFPSDPFQKPARRPSLGSAIKMTQAKADSSGSELPINFLVFCPGTSTSQDATPPEKTLSGLCYYGQREAIP